MKEKIKKNNQLGNENKLKMTETYEETKKITDEISLKLSQVIKA
jgi:hypothetical protein